MGTAGSPAADAPMPRSGSLIPLMIDGGVNTKRPGSGHEPDRRSDQACCRQGGRQLTAAGGGAGQLAHILDPGRQGHHPRPLAEGGD